MGFLLEGKHTKVHTKGQELITFGIDTNVQSLDGWGFEQLMVEYEIKILPSPQV